MNVLTVNTGSSSVKLAWHEAADDGFRTTHRRKLGLRRESAARQLEGFVAECGGRPDLVSHRVVHGGTSLTTPRRIDPEVETEIRRLSALAPLHNPVAARWIEASRALLGDDVPQYAVFDTGFYRDLPLVASTYALPRRLQRRHGIRRYGFHGIAHGAMNERWRELRPGLRGGGRLISAQLGAGCSLTATEGGRPRETSMGFSPVEGLVMATRAGDLDPTIVTYLQHRGALESEDIDRILNRESGLAGLAGGRHDMEALLQAEDEEAVAAVEIYCHRLRKYIGAYLAVLGGADGIVFGGGVGEHAAAIRACALQGMEWAGIRIDRIANASLSGNEGRISTYDSPVAVWILPVDEERILAREAIHLWRTGQPSP